MEALLHIPSASEEEEEERVHELFTSPAWLAALSSLQVTPFGEKRLKFSLAHVNTGTQLRIPYLVAMVTRVTKQDHDFLAELEDPTGTTKASIHRDAFKQHEHALVKGAVLLLQDVSLFRAPGEQPYLNIVTQALVHVFPVGSLSPELDLKPPKPTSIYSTRRKKSQKRRKKRKKKEEVKPIRLASLPPAIYQRPPPYSGPRESTFSLPK